MTTKVFLEWENTNFTWDNLNMLWEDVAILIEVGGIIRGGGGLQSYIDNNPWDVTKQKLGEEKTKRFIKIVCRVNDLDYEKVIEPNSNVKVKAYHLEKVFNEAVKIGVKIDF
jgi:hypothetical protein